MEKLTITEALSELNLIKKKAEKKQQNILNNIVRAKHLKDPFESEGGSKEYVRKELQALRDLTQRFIRIKAAIAKANIESELALNDSKANIYEWLVWKRDIKEFDSKFYKNVCDQVKSHMDRAQSQPQVYKDEEGKTQLLEIETNVDYPDFLKRSEETQDKFERLDGQLSLKNATTVLEF